MIVYHLAGPEKLTTAECKVLLCSPIKAKQCSEEIMHERLRYVVCILQDDCTLVSNASEENLKILNNCAYFWDFLEILVQYVE